MSTVRPGVSTTQMGAPLRSSGGHAQVVEFLLVEASAAAQVLAFHAGAGAEHAQGDRTLGHFKAEKAHGHAPLGGCAGQGQAAGGDLLGQVEGEGRLAHAGARREDEQFARLQAQQHAVHVVIACREARHRAPALFDGLDALHLDLEEFGQRLHLGGVAFLRDLEDRALGFVQHFAGAVGAQFAGVIGVVEDGPARVDEAAEFGLFGDDARKVRRVGVRGHRVGEFNEVIFAAA